MIHYLKNEKMVSIEGAIYLGQIAGVKWSDNTRLHEMKKFGQGEIFITFESRDDYRLTIVMDQLTLREVHQAAEDFDESLRGLDCEETLCGWVQGMMMEGYSKAEIQLEIGEYYDVIDREREKFNLAAEEAAKQFVEEHRI